MGSVQHQSDPPFRAERLPRVLDGGSREYGRLNEINESIDRLEAALLAAVGSSDEGRAFYRAKQQVAEDSTSTNGPDEEERQYIELFRLAHGLEPDRFAQSHRSTFTTFARVALVLLIAAVAVLWVVGKYAERFDGQAAVSTDDAAESMPASPSRVALAASTHPKTRADSVAQTPNTGATDGPIADRQPLPIDSTPLPHAEATGAKLEAVVAATPNTGATDGPIADRRPLPIDSTPLPHAEATGAKLEAVVAATPNTGATDGPIADRQPLPIDSTPLPHAEATGAKPEAVVAATPNTGATDGPMRGEGLPVGAVAVLDAETIAALLRRADAFVEVGDISAARVLLRRAAESLDPRAALALGATYDPTVLAKRGVQGLVGDVSTARTWYNRAKQLGSEEAQGRIDQLASQRR